MISTAADSSFLRRLGQGRSDKPGFLHKSPTRRRRGAQHAPRSKPSRHDPRCQRRGDARRLCRTRHGRMRTRCACGRRHALNTVQHVNTAAKVCNCQTSVWFYCGNFGFETRSDDQPCAYEPSYASCDGLLGGGGHYGHHDATHRRFRALVAGHLGPVPTKPTMRHKDADGVAGRRSSHSVIPYRSLPRQNGGTSCDTKAPPSVSVALPSLADGRCLGCRRIKVSRHW